MFHILPLNGQVTKTLQLSALRLVHAAALSAFKSLVGKKNRLLRLFPQSKKSQVSIFLTDTTSKPKKKSSSDQHDQVLYQGQSLSEIIHAKYEPTKLYNAKKLSTCTGHVRKLNPYNPGHPIYTNAFKIRFQGCFKCGQSLQANKTGYPLFRDTNRDTTKKFYKELYIHRPHLKDKPGYKQYLLRLKKAKNVMG